MKNSTTVEIKVEMADKLNPLELIDLCDATEATMLDTYGFSIGHNQWQPPMRDILERYFKGVLIIPERKLILGKIDETISSSLQIVLPHSINKTSNFAISIDNMFVAPWSRNLGIARKMLKFAEDFGTLKGYQIIKLSVRSNREAAITLYESLGYKKWGTLEKYEKVGNEIISGFFYYKEL